MISSVDDMIIISPVIVMMMAKSMTPIGSNFVLPLVKEKRMLIRPKCYKLYSAMVINTVVYIWATGHVLTEQTLVIIMRLIGGKLKNQVAM